MTCMKITIGTAALLVLAACSGPAPSVPFSPGKSIDAARDAINTCDGLVTGGGRKRAAAVESCMNDLGFARRELTEAELSALDSANPTTRSALLNHFVAGGQLETFSGT